MDRALIRLVQSDRWHPSNADAKEVKEAQDTMPRAQLSGPVHLYRPDLYRP